MKRRPGEVRDAIASILDSHPAGASVAEIAAGVTELIGATPQSSVRSYLRLNTPESFLRSERGRYQLNETVPAEYARTA